MVIYALRSPKGKIYRIEDAPVQGFTKKDFEGINRSISGKQEYILYEQLTRKHMRDKHGNKVPILDEKGNRKYVRTKSGKRRYLYYQAKKFTFYRPEFEQRPVLYNKGKRQRELDIGFKKLSPRQQADQEIMKVVRPSPTEWHEFVFEGESVRDALKNFILDIDKRKVYDSDGKKVAGLYYNLVTYVTNHVTGETIRIPAAGAMATIEEFSDVFKQVQIIDAPDERPALTQEVNTLANIAREISWAVTHSLSKVGYKFTKEKDLRKYAGQMSRNAAKLEKQGKAALNAGRAKEGEKKLKSAQRVRDARDKMLKDKAGKKYLDRRHYTVRILCQFETIKRGGNYE